MLAATLAQVGWGVSGVGVFLGVVLCSCMVLGSMLYFMCSSSTILLVKYALVSTKFEIMCLSMLSFLVGSVRFVKYLAQSTMFSLAQIRVPLASISSSSMSSSFILIHLIMHSLSIVSCSSGGPSSSGMSLSIISGLLKGLTGWYLFLALGVQLTLLPSGGPLGEGVTGLDVEQGSISRLSSSSIALLLHGFGPFMLSSRRIAFSS